MRRARHLCAASLPWSLQTLTPERGFSSAKFVPGTKDAVLLALKSTEDMATGATSSHLSVITLDGRELFPETRIPGDFKCVCGTCFVCLARVLAYFGNGMCTHEHERVGVVVLGVVVVGVASGCGCTGCGEWVWL